MRVERDGVVEYVGKHLRVFQDVLCKVEVVFVLDEVGVVDEDLGVLSGFGKILQQVGDVCGVEVDDNLVVRAYGVHTVGGLDHLAGVLFPLDDEIIELDGQVVTEGKVVIGLQMFGIFVQNFVIERVGFGLLARFLEITGLGERLVYLFAKRLHARVSVVLGEGGKTHRQEQNYEKFS